MKGLRFGESASAVSVASTAVVARASLACTVRTTTPEATPVGLRLKRRLLVRTEHAEAALAATLVKATAERRPTLQIANPPNGENLPLTLPRV
jgi:hypothetical protein